MVEIGVNLKFMEVIAKLKQGYNFFRTTLYSSARRRQQVIRTRSPL